MSRIGKAPITIPSGVEITVEGGEVKVNGPKGQLSQEIGTEITTSIEGDILMVQRPTEQKRHKALHGLYRSLIQNMVTGVTEGYSCKLELVGVGYKASVQGSILELNLGYSHNIFLVVPSEIKVSAETVKGKNPIVTLESSDKQLIGQVAAKIRSLRKIEPYKGKGIRFVGEEIRRKAGKTAAK
ncbi:MAG: 50S ribosomal protein L6 [Flammeovirgaceae bacterium]|nr:50S ribosomal protein L6 [Flammeovirgaceae bacterium]|tara:strand:- start:924 stop:1475 length:552 start_codon:yes stop_codon:yes gene_type:complete